jgi:hypothetical protein
VKRPTAGFVGLFVGSIHPSRLSSSCRSGSSDAPDAELARDRVHVAVLEVLERAELVGDSGACISEPLLIGSSFQDRLMIPPAISRVLATRLRYSTATGRAARGRSAPLEGEVTRTERLMEEAWRALARERATRIAGDAGETGGVLVRAWLRDEPAGR